MIRLSNGHQFNFAVAAGALNFDGGGYWWEKPLRWLGYIDPSKFTVITKTFTHFPRKGNLRWWCPWRCVRLLPGDGAVNAVGLTNPGIEWWARNQAKHEYDWPMIISIAPENGMHAQDMVRKIYFNHLVCVKGIQLNVSCPNTDHKFQIEHVLDVVKGAKRAYTDMSLSLKLGPSMPILEIIEQTKGNVDFYELINTGAWELQQHAGPSPLAKYGLTGGVSGRPLVPMARHWLQLAREQHPDVQILSGGGVMEYDEVIKRFDLGANGVAFGTLFLRRPWMPNRIVDMWERTHANKSIF